MTSTSQRISPLPLEVWTRILGSVVDSCYLPRTWLNCRRVSHAFKAATEMAFVDVYLPQMTIGVELAEPLRLGFSGLSQDREFAHFRGASADQRDVLSRIPRELRARLKRQTERGWQKEHERYLSSVQSEAPFLLYQVWLMGYVEDPAFPDLQVDTTRRTISFRWKPLLSTMFGELEYRKWMFRKQVANGEADGVMEGMFAAESVRMRSVEMRVRKSRPRNRGWNKFFESWRRQEWQLDALLAYRGDSGTITDPEEEWGTFYNVVKPRYRYTSLLRPLEPAVLS